VGLAAALCAQPSDKATQRLIKDVRTELVMMPFYGVFDNLSFKLDGYSVTLMGQVTRPTLKSEAENRVKRIEGIEKVVNNIEVLPLSPNDDRIRIAVYRAIFAHPTLQQYTLRAVPPIHIIVKNGNVTLEGVVARPMEKNVAGIQANQVPGVFSVPELLVAARALIGRLALAVTLHAGAHVVLHFLRDDIALGHGPMTGLALHARVRMVLVTEENVARNLVDPYPRHRTFRLVPRRHLRNVR
jgi:hyperosmotically inducible protein